MNIGILRALRNMSGNTTPTLNLSDMRYNHIEHNQQMIDKISDAITRDFPDFSGLYNYYVNQRNVTAERVFHEALLLNFTEMVKLRGVDIIYSDITIHVKIIIDGVDVKTIHTNLIEREDRIVDYEGSTVIVHFTKFRTDDRNEYWEYYIAM